MTQSNGGITRPKMNSNRLIRRTRCEVCDHITANRGHYRFRYLDETVFLCGHDAGKVMRFIKKKRSEVLTEKRKKERGS